MLEPRTIPGNFCTVHGYHWPPPARTVRHHITPLGDGGPDTPENECLVCDTGHYNIHEYYNARKKGLTPPKVTRNERDIAEQGLAGLQ